MSIELSLGIQMKYHIRNYHKQIYPDKLNSQYSVNSVCVLGMLCELRLCLGLFFVIVYFVVDFT